MSDNAELIARFDSWWLASKYCQVVIPREGWRQIALDGYQAALREAAQERERLREALRYHCVSTGIGPGPCSCFQCETDWEPGSPEQHAPGCLAAKQTAGDA